MTIFYFFRAKNQTVKQYRLSQRLNVIRGDEGTAEQHGSGSGRLHKGDAGTRAHSEDQGFMYSCFFSYPGNVLQYRIRNNDVIGSLLQIRDVIAIRNRLQIRQLRGMAVNMAV